ncbi:hypothetical protein [Terrimonas pollutisoli]|uniref:hypothetical protein n=1 Tax=Terrimonas pollutisoli TaxID=3034147 RepID=UPI0023EC7603|nr:hypothetical protein [Terrimonas sp. H1YJ31]
MTIISYSEKEQIFIETGLHELTGRLIRTFIPRACSNRSFFVNDIPAGLTIASNLQMFATVLSGLLSAVVTHAKDSCIRLSAKTYGNVVMLELKEATSCDIFLL